MPTIELPTLHVDQVNAYRIPGLRKAIRCGRRWGKSALAETIACDAAAKRQSVGYFTPAYKFQSEIFNDISEILAPIKASSSKVEGVIRTTTGGRIDFWTLENERAGRSRKYHKVIIDEAAFGKGNTTAIWQQSIEPTLLDYTGTAWVFSNTNGNSPENFFYRVCNDEKLGFKEYHAPTFNNPHIPEHRNGESEVDFHLRRDAEFEKLKREKHPLVYRQEYLAEFVDFSGTAFFSSENLLDANGQPVEFPSVCDSVFAVIDSAVKQGKDHDGTAVSYWAKSGSYGIPLICLDWDILSIDGALLEAWIPNVFRRLEELAKACRARYGSQGAFIEDASSGAILLQQCTLRGLPARPLPSDLTAAGKDGRALNASGPVYQGQVKWSRHAYDKVATFHEQTQNHMLMQVYGFRVGDKDANKRADDLFDTFVYAVAISLGNSEGIA